MIFIVLLSIIFTLLVVSDEKFNHYYEGIRIYL